MNDDDEATRLLSKADRFCRSARLLLEAEDADSACSRAYYAMFDAARAALMLSGDALSAAELGKTHRGLIRRFNERLIKTGSLPMNLGGLLRKAETLRTLADYRVDAVDPVDAAEAVDRAEHFVSSIRSAYRPDGSAPR